MPRSAAFVFALAALTAACAFAVHVLSSSPSPPPNAGSDHARTTAHLELRALRERIDDLEREVFQPRLRSSDPAERLARMEMRLETLETSRSATTGDDSTGKATASSPSLRAARSEAERAQPSPSPRSLTDEALLVQARALSSKQARHLAAPYWREILARGPTDERFIEAQLEIGYAHRYGKEHEKEEEAFQEALRVAGVDTEQGQAALYQIAWSQHFRGDEVAASRTMASVAAHPATPRLLKGHARLNGAHFWLEQNDTESAREALESIVQDFGGTKVPIDVWFVRQATTRLEQIQ